VMKAEVKSYTLGFKQPAGTSRGVLRDKQCYFLKITDASARYPVGWGEVGVLRGLSMDDVPELEHQLDWTAKHIQLGLEKLYRANTEFPSIQFALEQAFSHLENGFQHFDTPYSRGEAAMSINGLIWMGDEAFMLDQISKRLAEGFTTLKMKVGAIDWTTERKLLEGIRREFPEDKLVLRVDANGAFNLHQALLVDEVIADLAVHSIEQPLPVNDREGLATLAATTKVPIALDESLIGLVDEASRSKLLDDIRPPFIILKPSFIGGWQGSDQWIALAEERGIGWWATSALESNIGLNAIAQWASTKGNSLPQGLGTGSLYTNNIPGPHLVSGGEISIPGDVQQDWDLSVLL